MWESRLSWLLLCMIECKILIFFLYDSRSITRILTRYSKRYLKLACTCLIHKQWGSPHGHWNRIHWIRIPMWSRLSCTVRRLRALHCWTGSRTLTRRSKPFGSGSRLCGGKVVFGSGSSIRIGSGSKVPCGEPHYKSIKNQYLLEDNNLIQLCFLSPYDFFLNCPLSLSSSFQSKLACTCFFPKVLWFSSCI